MRINRDKTAYPWSRRLATCEFVSLDDGPLVSPHGLFNTAKAAHEFAAEFGLKRDSYRVKRRLDVDMNCNGRYRWTIHIPASLFSAA
jgi:hypothetical protein